MPEPDAAAAARRTRTLSMTLTALTGVAFLAGCRTATETTDTREPGVGPAVVKSSPAPLPAASNTATVGAGAGNAAPAADVPNVAQTVVRRLLSLAVEPAHDAPLTPAASTAAVARVAGSPGLVVCYPAAVRGASEEQADFAAGCGFYLSLHAAGRPEFGQTPLLTSVSRAARQVGQPSLRIGTPADAAKVAAVTGATHVAVGDVSGDAGKGTLTYRIYKAVPKGGAPVPVGAPLTSVGTRAQILKALPKLAGSLRMRLLPALAKAPLPPATTASPDELTRIGDAASTAAVTPEQSKFLAGAWKRVPEAGVLHLTDERVRWDLAYLKPIVTRLLAAYPDNPLVLAHIGYGQAAALLPHEATVRASARRHPRSYALAHTEVWLSRAGVRPDLERIAAARAVRNAPRNPDAYLSYGWTLSSSAQAVRRGKFYGRMSAEEAAFVERVYPQWFAAVRRAAALDPNYGMAWLRVATAGTFAGQEEEAEAAYAKARRLLGPVSEVFYWGLQMFQPKWGGDPAKLRAVAEDAARALYANPYDAMQVADAIKDAGVGDIARKMAEDLVAKSDAALAKKPNDGQARYARAVALRRLERWPEATAEYEEVARLFPGNAQVQFEVGDYLSDRSQWRQAEAALRNAVRLDPRHARAQCLLGWVLKQQNKLAEAEKALRTAVTLAPGYGQAWTVLGTVYAHAGRDDAGIAAYKKALSLSVYNSEVFHNLTTMYFRKKDWRSAAATAGQGAAQYPENAAFYTMLGAAYLETREYARSEAASRQAIALNDNDAVAHHNLGMALIRQKQRAEGRKELLRGLEIGGQPEMVKEAQEMLAKHPD